MGDVCTSGVFDVAAVDCHNSERDLFPAEKDTQLPVLPTRYFNIHRHYSRITEARIRVDRLAVIPGLVSTYQPVFSEVLKDYRYHSANGPKKYGASSFVKVGRDLMPSVHYGKCKSCNDFLINSLNRSLSSTSLGRSRKESHHQY